MRALALVPLIACVERTPTPPLDLRGHDVDLLIDEQSLAVTGCLTGIVGGCSQPQGNDSMAVTVDGQTWAIPFDPTLPDPNVLLDTGQPVFRTVLSAPSDLHVVVMLAGDTGGIDLPGTFAIAGVPAQVSRSSETLTLTYDLLPDAHASATETVTCGNQQFGPALIPDTMPGELRVYIDTLEPGTCTHDVTITQVLSLPAASPFIGTSGRREMIEFTSLP